MVSALASRSACFNPRPREGGDTTLLHDTAGVGVSIHAPVKGATAVLIGPYQVEVEVVSIHAPVKGATSAACPCTSGHIVSIHAPVKGATSVRVSTCVPRNVSIHAPVKGATSKSEW